MLCKIKVGCGGTSAKDMKLKNLFSGLLVGDPQGLLLATLGSRSVKHFSVLYFRVYDIQ